MNEESREKIRAFVAVYPGREIAERLEQAQGRLRSEIPPNAIRWTHPGQIHLTLNFLGDIESRRVPEFAAAIRHASIGCASFVLRVEAMGCFPNERRPRVLWAGLAGDVARLRGLKERLDDAMSGLGIVPEERFSPHLTLGRVRQIGPRDVRHLSRLLHELRNADFGEWTVRGIDLMRSVLGSAGARHERVGSFDLLKQD